jgi:hypothetical protein
MPSVDLANSHQWVRRRVSVNGKLFYHRQCSVCRRDFVMAADTGYWKSAHIGLLGFDFLNEETDRSWLSEECPGRPLAAEINDLRS